MVEVDNETVARKAALPPGGIPNNIMVQGAPPLAVTVSICIPCYKSERFIRTAIESALAQTAPASEILASDDNSPDRTFEILSEYVHLPNVRLIRPPHRLTLGQHYRFLLERAVGDYVCFLSHDDALMPSFLETMLAKVDREVSLIAAACLECDARLAPRRAHGIALPKSTLDPPNGFLHFRKGNGYTISFSLMSRQKLLEIPCLPPEADLATDWYWAMMLGLRGKVRFVRKPMGYYRFHESNAAAGDGSAKWLMNCEALLRFLRNNVEPQFRQDIDERLKRCRASIAELKSGAGSNKAQSSLRMRLKNSIKCLIALRYRKLPPVIAQAELSASRPGL